MRRYTLAGFTSLGTLQSRHGVIEGAEGTLAATRDPLVAATRHAEVDALGGCLGARSYGVPDVSGGVSVAFEVVSGGVSVAFEAVSGGVSAAFEEVYPI